MDSFSILKKCAYTLNRTSLKWGERCMQNKLPIEFVKRLASALAKQFGLECEIVIHDLTLEDKEHTIVYIENGHVTHRTVGDGASEIVLETLRHHTGEDQIGYCITTEDGRLLRSSTIYIKNDVGEVEGIFSINYDLTKLILAENVLGQMIKDTKPLSTPPKKITTKVEDLLEELIERATQLIGKPVTLMNKEDKIRAIQFLEEAGAFLITKSGDKVSEYFGISKYTLYNYMEKKNTK